MSAPVKAVHLLVPDGIDDPRRPSGGNVYDRRVADCLAAGGWRVREHAVGGSWPAPDDRARAEFGRLVAALPDRCTVLVDGLIASAAAPVLVPQAERLSLVVLMHLPLGEPGGEGDVLRAARAVVTTSGWTRDRLLETHRLPRRKIHVAEPGVDPARTATGTPDGTRLLAVAAVLAAKGHDILLRALAEVGELSWQCELVGSLDRDPAFVARLRRRIDAHGLGDRVILAGQRTGPALDDAYAAADVLVHASRGETYGMVVTESLARGVPVIATAVGGVPAALGWASGGARPGLLVAPHDGPALADALRRWLLDGGLRARLRRAARERRSTLTGWPVTARRIAAVLDEVSP
jgi:glycosyltransferase involved in cell wall biosynthesis